MTPSKNHPEQPTLPDPPAGYAEPYAVSYPTIVLIVGSGVLGVVSAVGFISLLVWIHGGSIISFYTTAVTNGAITWSVDLTQLAVPVIAAIVVTAIVHELIHGLAFRWYGYEVTFGFVPTVGAFYAGAFGAFQKKDELLRVGIAPLLVITSICLPLMVVPVPIVALTATFILILNTAGSIADVYLLWRLLQLPDDTLLYDVDIQQMYLYEPVAD